MAKLYFYYSAMNAGKSTNLLQSSHNYKERGMDTLLLTPQLDDRFGIGKISSRIGLTDNAVKFDNGFAIDLFVKNALAENPNIHCVLIDEAQFLTKIQVKQLTVITDQMHIPVLTYGLRSDFQGEPFEGSQYLLAWADELAEIKTICHCGKKATMNVRLGADGRPTQQGEQVRIGGNDTYIPCCRRHFSESITNPNMTLPELTEIA